MYNRKPTAKDMLALSWATTQAQRIDNEMTRLMRAIPTVPSIHHYTTIETAKNILSSNEFWMTDYRFMNDRTEFQHSYEILMDRLKRHQLLLPKSRQKMLPIILEAIERNHVPNIFITSFSGARDLKSQWSEYGGNFAGCSLALNTDRVAADIANSKFVAYGRDGVVTSRILCLEVEYNDEKKIAKIDAVLNRYLPVLCKLFDEGAFYGQTRTTVLAPFCGALYQLLSSLKNRYSYEEHEVRFTLMLLSTSVEKSLKTAGMRTPFQRHIREGEQRPTMTLKRLKESWLPRMRRSMQVNIATLVDLISPLSFSEIMLGPRSQKASEENIRELLKSSHQESVCISHSEIPY